MNDQMRPPEPQPAGWEGAPWSPATVPADGPSEQATGWALAAHLTNFLLPAIAPLIIRAFRGQDPFVRRHATEAFNFGLTWTLLLLALVVAVAASMGIGVLPFVGVLDPVAFLGAAALGMVVSFVLFGVLTLAILTALGMYLALTCVAAATAGSGRAYRYPLTFRFLR